MATELKKWFFLTTLNGGGERGTESIVELAQVESDPELQTTMKLWGWKIASASFCG